MSTNKKQTPRSFVLPPPATELDNDIIPRPSH